MNPAVASLLVGAASTVAGMISNKKNNERRIKNMEKANEMSLANRRNEDTDKVESLRRAGLNPSLAYSNSASAVPVSPVETSSADFSSLSSSAPALGSLLQNQPLVDEQVKQSSSITKANEANAEKATAEAEAIRQNIADKTGENQGSYFKLQEFGLKPSDLKVEYASGYLRALDFGDEHVTKGAERGLRRLSSQLDSQIKSRCLTDSVWNKKFQDAYASTLDSLLLDPKLKGEELISKKQNNALFNLRKMNLQAEYNLKVNQSFKTAKEAEKAIFDIEEVKERTKIAQENSFQNILSNIHSAYVRDDYEVLS